MKSHWPSTPLRRWLSRTRCSRRLALLGGLLLLLLTAGCLGAVLPDDDQMVTPLDEQTVTPIDEQTVTRGGEPTDTPDCSTATADATETEQREKNMTTPEWETENEPPEHDAARWIRLIGGSEWDAANAVVQGHDGGYVFTGRIGSTFYVAHLNSSGRTVWEQRGLETTGETAATGGRCEASPTATRSHSSGKRDKEQGETGDRHAFGRDIIRTPDGGYVVAAGDYLVKLDSGGDVVWAHQVGPRASTVVRTTDGDYVVAGGTHGGGWDGWIARITPGGETKWQRSFGGPKDDIFHSLTRTADGGFVAAGYTNSVEQGQAPWVVKVDPTGDGRWSRVVGTEGQEGWAEDIVRTQDGGFALTGYRVGSTEDGIGLWKLAANGTTRWGKTYGSGSGAAIRQTSDGGYAIGGTETAEARLLAIDNDGELRDELTYGTDGHAYGVGLALTPDGDYVLVGRYKESFPFDILVVEFRL